VPPSYEKNPHHADNLARFGFVQRFPSGRISPLDIEEKLIANGEF
jgi:hypothetical protein